MQAPESRPGNSRPGDFPPANDAPAPSLDSGGMARILHDVRGLLSPAMLSADRLSLHPDPQVRGTAEQIVQSIEQAVRRLKDLPTPR